MCGICQALTPEVEEFAFHAELGSGHAIDGTDASSGDDLVVVSVPVGDALEIHVEGATSIVDAIDAIAWGAAQPVVVNQSEDGVTLSVSNSGTVPIEVEIPSFAASGTGTTGTTASDIVACD